MKATEQYFPVVPFIILYKVVLTSDSEDEIFTFDHSNERYEISLWKGLLYCVHKTAATQDLSHTSSS